MYCRRLGMATLDDLVAALEDSDPATTTTSVRQPVALRRALKAAVELGLAPSANDATNESVRIELEHFALRRALDEHYETYPWTKPSLYQLGYATAVLERSPLTERKDLLRQAAKEITRVRPDASGEDVLLWAHSLLVHEARTSRA
jgi:hypothetical protein